MREITEILRDAGAGHASAAAALLPLVYEQLRSLARRKMAAEAPGQTLQPTTLVHEAWLRLAGANAHPFQNRAHFFAAAAEAMRRILIDRARRRLAARRGGGGAKIDLDEIDLPSPVADDDQLLALDEALQKFAALVVAQFLADLFVNFVGQVKLDGGERLGGLFGQQLRRLIVRGQQSGEALAKSRIVRADRIQKCRAMPNLSGVAISPNGRFAAICTELGYIQLHEAPFQDPSPAQTLRGFLLGVHSLAFSQDSHRLAAGGTGDEAVKIWDLASRQEILTLKGESSVFRHLTYSPDGGSILAININRLCHIWTAPGWSEITSLEPSRQHP